MLDNRERSSLFQQLALGTWRQDYFRRMHGCRPDFEHPNDDFGPNTLERPFHQL